MYERVLFSKSAFLCIYTQQHSKNRRTHTSFTVAHIFGGKKWENYSIHFHYFQLSEYSGCCERYYYMNVQTENKKNYIHTIYRHIHSWHSKIFFNILWQETLYHFTIFFALHIHNTHTHTLYSSCVCVCCSVYLSYVFKMCFVVVMLYIHIYSYHDMPSQFSFLFIYIHHCYHLSTFTIKFYMIFLPFQLNFVACISLL